MTLEQMLARVAEIRTEIDAIYGDGTAVLSDEQSARFTELEAESATLRTAIETAETRARSVATIRSLADRVGNIEIPDASGPQVRVTNDPFDLRTLSFTASPGDVRARALTAIEQVPELPDSARQQASKLVSKLGPELARRILFTGSLAYRTAYQKAMVGQASMWDNAERDAFRTALGLTDGNGGYAVPFTLDPTIISTKDVSTNPFRRISRNVTTLTDSWNGITSAGVTASFDAEAAEVSDDSPTLTGPAISVHMARAFVRASIEISQDWASIESDLRMLIQEAKDDLEGQKFATGSGTNEPFGIVTALDDTTSEVDPATAETFAIADVYALENALPPKYRLAVLDGDTAASRASWVGERSTYNKVRQFDTQGGAGLWEVLGRGLPPQLIGYNAYEASAMRGFSDINVAATAENPILILGDFRYYVIVDRVGLNIEFIPHLFHTGNNLPSGQRGWFAYWRVGADSVNDAAFRMLDIDTAA